MKATAISVSPVRHIPSGGGVGRFLSKPRVFKCLSPAPVKGNDLRGFGEDPAVPATDAWGNTNKALSSLSTVINTGTKFYIQQQQVKQAQQGADNAEAQAASAAQALKVSQQAAAERARLAALSQPEPGLPSWALPAIIGGVALLGVGAFFYFRKKSG